MTPAQHTAPPSIVILAMLLSGCSGGDTQQFTPQTAPPVIEEPRPVPVTPPAQPPPSTPPPVVQPPPPTPVVPPIPPPPTPVTRAALPPWFVYCDFPPCLVYTVDGFPIQTTSLSPGSPLPQGPMNFPTTTLSAEHVTTVFFEHPDIPNAAVALHEQMIAIIDTEREITGTTSERVTAFFLPTELAAFFAEGNVSFGNGTITMNYSNVGFIAAMGGIMATVVPRAAHEYAHELFNELVGSFAGDYRCLNEGVADALAYVSGFLPLQELGPIGVRGVSFEAGCDALSAIHDIGNCYFWHLRTAGQLTPAFFHRFFHPTRHYTMNTCDPTSLQTGQTLFALFTEASGGANLNNAFLAMRIPHE